MGLFHPGAVRVHEMYLDLRKTYFTHSIKYVESRNWICQTAVCFCDMSTCEPHVVVTTSSHIASLCDTLGD